MNQPLYIKPWLSNRSWVISIFLFFILLSAIIAFSSFALSQNYMIAYLGAQPEDITFSIQICYAGILSALPIQARFIRYFEMKYYIIVVMICGILLSAACLVTTDMILFFIIRFLQGFVVCCVAACILTLIIGALKPELKQVVSSSIFYGTVLSSGVLIAIIASRIGINTDFKYIFHYVMLFQVIALILVMAGFNGRSNFRSYPLYQLDWIAAIFFIAAAAAFAYLMVYGSKYYWFTERRIVYAALIFSFSFSLYIFRCLTVKRPLINLRVFSYPKFWLGLILLILYYGIKESINIIFGYTSAVLQWSAPRVVELALYNVAGLITFMTISAVVMVRKKIAITGFLLAGFSLLLIYHIWMYFIFTPDLSFQDLILPMLLQGGASGLLFVPIVVFILTSVPPETGIAGLVVGTWARFIALLNAGAGFYNLQLYYNQVYRDSFLGHLTSIDPVLTERLERFRQLYQSKGYTSDQAIALANVALSKALGLQGQLLANRATFGYMAILSAVIILVILTILLFRTFTRKAVLIQA